MMYYYGVYHAELITFLIPRTFYVEYERNLKVRQTATHRFIANNECKQPTNNTVCV